MKCSGGKGFPVLHSGTSGLHVCNRDVSTINLFYCMGESWCLYFRSRVLCLKQPIKKKSNLLKNPMPPEPFLMPGLQF